MILTALLLAAAPTIPRGDRLKPIEQCFALTRAGKDGPMTIGATYQRIRSVRVAGKPAWDVVVHQRIAALKFDLRDHFVLARKDLTPIIFESRKGGLEHVTLRYAGNRITGTRIEKGETKAIDLVAPGAVWEGNLWGITFGAMPLVAGRELSLPFYQYDKGFGRFVLTVTGSETVATPSGPVEAWAVAASIDGRSTGTTLIAKSDGTELGSRAKGFGSQLGGDCTGLD